ncbi:MAG: Zn-dependent hydrolase [Amphritea sp.]
MTQITDKTLRINGTRLWSRLMAMAEIGATDKGGCNRQALTETDKAGRDLFIQWCENAGCTVQWDQIGNIFVRRPGRNNDLPPVITGSHLDTQPTGGKFDGVYGVLAGLEVIETLNDNQIETDAPVEVVVWTNEEGARFSPAMLGSGVFTGVFELDQALAIRDKQGISVGEALASINYSGSLKAQARPIKAAFEAHIEQGPILESENRQIGIVSGVQGMRWYDLTITGQPAHAGPTPMELRRDPFMGLTAIINKLYALADEFGPWFRVTFGDIKAEPGVRNTVPEKLIIAVDLRHPEQEKLDQIDTLFRQITEEECDRHNLNWHIHDEWHSPAVAFADICVDAVSNATRLLGYTNMSMFSGAGHDSVYVSRIAPTSMVFVPCEKGISHNEAENARSEDLEAGCNVLLNAIISVVNS